MFLFQGFLTIFVVFRKLRFNSLIEVTSAYCIYYTTDSLTINRKIPLYRFVKLILAGVLFLRQGCLDNRFLVDLDIASVLVHKPVLKALDQSLFACVRFQLDALRIL